MSRLYDVSISVRTGGLVYPGNPGILIEPQQAISKGAGANVSTITFGSHTGTHVDAARHFFDDGQTVDQIPPGKFVGPAILIAFDEPDRVSVGAADLLAHDLQNQKRVLIRTRNSGRLKNPEFDPKYVFLAPDGAEYLVSLGIELVGVDYLSIEQFHSGHHLTHRALLEKQIVIIEGLDLSEPEPGAYQLICLPLKLEGLDGAPARALLIG